MSISSIFIIVFICIAIVLICISLIYTKIIKSNDFCYTSNSIFVKFFLKRELKSLKKISEMKECHIDISFNLEGLTLFNIQYLFLSKNKIYLMTLPLYWNVKNVFIKDKKIFCKVNKKELTLPMEIDFFLDKIKKFKNNFSLSDKEIKIIIPYLNKKMESSNLNNIDFVYLKNIKNFIESENKLNEWNDVINKKFNKIIENSIIQKPRRSIFYLRNTNKI